MNTNYRAKPWMRYTLMAAGVYNLVWGFFAVVWPEVMLGWLGVEFDVTAAKFWQCIGMIVGVYGIGYFIAASAPYRHWALTLVGLLGKVFGPIGFVAAIFNGSLPVSMGWTILANDLIWWAPFIAILWGANRYHQAIGSAYDTPESDDPLCELRTNTGKLLDDLANSEPQLVVFLRHAGCTFCRQTLADLSSQREEIASLGCGIVLVHLADDEPDAQEIFDRYGVGDLPRISDPTCRLYRQFGLDLGGFSELFGVRVWIQGIISGFINGHGIGRVRGNSFQMPGVYLYHCGLILDGFRHETASDRPDYLALARQIQIDKSMAG